MRPMFSNLRFLLIPALSVVSLYAAAQASVEGKGCKAPINRQLYHDYIDREQKAIFRMDGKPDNFLYAGENEDK